MLARALQKQSHGSQSPGNFSEVAAANKIQPKLQCSVTEPFPMINKSLLFAALAGVAVSSSAFAFPVAEAANPAKLPMPKIVTSSIVQPSGLPRDFAGGLVNVEFTLDAAGQPRDIKVLRVDNPVLKRQIAAAFSQWRFTADAATTEKRFVLPLQIRAEDV